MHSSNESEADLLFSKAEKLVIAHKSDEAQVYIKKGLENDIKSVPFFDIFYEEIENGEGITFVYPKRGNYSKQMILDGMSFYSYVLEVTIKFLLSDKHIKQIVSLDNVVYLSDLGPMSLYNLQCQAKDTGGEIKYVNASKAIRTEIDFYLESDNKGCPYVYHSVSEAIADFIGT